MENNLEKKYGLPTAIAMVVGIVIGSGVFFKAEKILVATGGNLVIGILAWIIGGLIMVSCAYSFSLLAAKYEKVNGIVDYAEAAFGKTYGYAVGWFMAIIYYPTLTAVLAWVSAKYTCILLNFKDPVAGAEVYVIAALYLIIIYAINALSPVLAGKFQVSTTVIKLVPLGLVAIVGLVMGLISGQTIENFTAVTAEVTGNPLLISVVATAFAYEGWIIATSINAELKDAKKNLPLALLIGTITVVIVYVLYFIGLAGAMPTTEFMGGGEAAVKLAFGKLLGGLGGSTLFVFVVISCLGTLNGLTLGCTRGIYALAIRKMGPKPEMFKQIDKETNMPTNSAVFGLLLTAIWLTIWYGNFAGWWGTFLDVSELPIVTMYALYIPIFVWIMKTMTELNSFKRIIVPLVSICGSIFMIVAACYSHKFAVVIYLVIFAIIMAIGLYLKGSKASVNESEQTISK